MTIEVIARELLRRLKWLMKVRLERCTAWRGWTRRAGRL